MQTHGTAIGPKMAVAFANTFMSAIETEIIRPSSNKPLVWKRYIDGIFSLWNIDKKDIGLFIELANNHHPTIKFTAEISDTEITFLDTCRAAESRENLALTCERISNRQNLSSTQNFSPVTLRASGKAGKASLKV